MTANLARQLSVVMPGNDEAKACTMADVPVLHTATLGAAFGRALIPHRKVSVILDSNGPVAGLTGIFSRARGRKYFKGPNPPRLADLTDTELVLYGP